MWENLAHGRGVDPQEVINQQVVTYDIFVGILWSRFGTPTKRAGSGTEEEFLQAFQLADGGHPVRFLVFNRTSPLPTDVDADQLQRVREFRRLINKRGVLPHNYQDFKEFEQLFRREILLFLNEKKPHEPEMGGAVKAAGPHAKPSRQATAEEGDPHRLILRLIHSIEDQLQSAIAKRSTSTPARFRSQIERLLVEFEEKCTTHRGAIEPWTFAKAAELMRQPEPEKVKAVAALVDEIGSAREAASEWQALLERIRHLEPSIAKEAGRVQKLLGETIRSLLIAEAACGVTGKPLLK